MSKTLEEIARRVKTLTHEEQLEILEIIKSRQKRTFQRSEKPVEIDVLVGEQLIQTVLKNVSASGVFFKHSRNVDVDQDVRVVFAMPGVEKPFKIKGKIVRVEPDGLAVEFKDMTPYLMEILDEAVCQGPQN